MLVVTIRRMNVRKGTEKDILERDLNNFQLHETSARPILMEIPIIFARTLMAEEFIYVVRKAI